MNKNLLKQSILAATIAGLSTMAVSCGKKQDQAAQQQQAPSIEVITVAPGTSELANSFPAIIKGKTDIEVRPLVSGFITKVCVDEGQQVKKGQTLFILDQVQYQAAVQQAVASVNSAKAAVNTAQSNERNQKMLYDKGIISVTQWQNSADQLAQAKAGLAQAQAALTTARKNLSYTVVTAPSNGVVGTIPNREGSLASPQSAVPLTTVSDVNQVYAYFSLNEKDLLALTDNGQKTVTQALQDMPEVQLRLANGEMYPLMGKVSTVAGSNDNSTGSAQVRALFQNTNGMLRSGSTGQIIIPNINNSALMVPQKATFELQDKRFVYVVNDSNTVTSRPIEVLDINDGQNFVVVEGLQAGERIAVEGVGTVVREGITIQPVTAAEKAKQQAAQAQQAGAQAK
ncbi:MAG: efflux RND transporter periplasmic adaptor subunit [Muribaculaceae bacterium]|nr:efflux RND transporter periplasmic adaptor subunit [Muribaculaceae bacterium]